MILNNQKVFLLLKLYLVRKKQIWQGPIYWSQNQKLSNYICTFLIEKIAL